MNTAASIATGTVPAAIVPISFHVLQPVQPVDAPPPLRVTGGAAHLAACDLCCLNTLCLPAGMSAPERTEYTGMIAQHRKLSPGEALYHAGDLFTHLYLIKTGTFKTVVLLNDGREQITGFRLPGDTLGIDAISYSVHASDAVALEEARVCAIPFAQLSRMGQQSVPVQTHLHRLLAHEVVSDQGVMLLLGRMQAEERVATFLLNLARRYEARGQSRSEFMLAMTREETGIYLGLTLETVSRCFSRFKHSGLLGVEGRLVRILDYDGLCRIIGAQKRLH